jgi:hypothetical protein
VYPQKTHDSNVFYFNLNMLPRLSLKASSGRMSHRGRILFCHAVENTYETCKKGRQIAKKEETHKQRTEADEKEVQQMLG